MNYSNMCIFLKQEPIHFCFIFFDIGAEVQKKIRSVRTQYGRERQKVSKQKSGDGLDDVYVSKWLHFEKLKFLDDFITAKQSVSNFKVIMYT